MKVSQWLLTRYNAPDYLWFIRVGEGAWLISMETVIISTKK